MDTLLQLVIVIVGSLAALWLWPIIQRARTKIKIQAPRKVGNNYSCILHNQSKIAIKNCSITITIDLVPIDYWTRAHVYNPPPFINPTHQDVLVDKTIAFADAIQPPIYMKDIAPGQSVQFDVLDFPPNSDYFAVGSELKFNPPRAVVTKRAASYSGLFAIHGEGITPIIKKIKIHSQHEQTPVEILN